LGTLEPGKLADLLLIPRKTADPFQDLIDLKPEDIGLLIVDGVPVYGDVRFLNQFAVYSYYIRHIDVAGKEKFLFGDLENLLISIDRTLGHVKNFDFLPMVEFPHDRASEEEPAGFSHLP